MSGKKKGRKKITFEEYLPAFKVPEEVFIYRYGSHFYKFPMDKEDKFQINLEGMTVRDLTLIATRKNEKIVYVD